LLYKRINARAARSTALVTNIDFEAWGDYLGDPPLAMAFLDRIVDGAIILKINGKSYRAHRAQQAFLWQAFEQVNHSRSAKDAVTPGSG
jgi:DNA replication protein DnaC